MSGSFPSHRQLEVYRAIRDSDGWIDTPYLEEVTGDTSGTIRHMVRFLMDRDLIKHVDMRPAPKYRWLGPAISAFDEELEDLDNRSEGPRDPRMLDPKVREARSRGGRVGGKRRMETMTPERRSEIARLGGIAAKAKADARRAAMEAAAGPRTLARDAARRRARGG